MSSWRRSDSGLCSLARSAILTDRLVQVFVNLLRNALNAIEAPSGRIEVRSRLQVRGGQPWSNITVSLPAAG